VIAVTVTGEATVLPVVIISHMPPNAQCFGCGVNHRAEQHGPRFDTSRAAHSGGYMRPDSDQISAPSPREVRDWLELAEIARDTRRALAPIPELDQLIIELRDALGIPNGEEE